MNAAFFISAFVLGFMGSFHCAGMCGPLALMLPGAEGSTLNAVKGKMIYNLGRVFTYSMIGLLFGALGLAVVLRGFQKELSVITGIIILIVLIFSSLNIYRFRFITGTNYFTKFIRNNLKFLFAKKTSASLFLIGVLNGLLPCGFVYLAIAGAASAGSVSGGIFYMIMFGLGTFPIMMMILIAANFVGINFRKSFSKLSNFVAIILALFLIYRGTMMKMNDCCKEKISIHPVYCSPTSIAGHESIINK
jgi:sulfite exporter TauE/SafE